MARVTFQGLVRSTGGRPSSIVGSNRLPAHVLRYTMGGVIQIRSSDIANKTVVVGMLPAFFFITGRVAILSPGGNVAVTLPAFEGLPLVTLRPSAAVVVGTQVDITTGEVYAIERPVAITGDAGAVGTFALGLLGFPLDDAAVASN